jgi:hypothetical protein
MIVVIIIESRLEHIPLPFLGNERETVTWYISAGGVRERRIDLGISSSVRWRAPRWEPMKRFSGEDEERVIGLGKMLPIERTHSPVLFVRERFNVIYRLKL